MEVEMILLNLTEEILENAKREGREVVEVEMTPTKGGGGGGGGGGGPNPAGGGDPADPGVLSDKMIRKEPDIFTGD